MKHYTFFFLLFQLILVHAQETNLPTAIDIEIEIVKQFQLDADEFIGADNFDNFYYIKNNTLLKKNGSQLFSYSNTQLGKITSVDITNPLKILLFYKNFNTVLFLDNKLNELTTSINFTSETFLQQISFVTISSNNNLWLYSLDDNEIQLWNHQTKKVQFTSQPLSSYVNDFEANLLTSSYKYCWLFGEASILKFNEYGIFINSSIIDEHTHIKPFQEGFMYVKNNELYYQNPSMDFNKINMKPIGLIKNFYINSDKVYIFDGTKVFIFKIIKNK